VFCKKKFFIYILFLLLSTGCAVKQFKIAQTRHVDYQEIVAKFSDLPDAPFQAQLKNIVVCPVSNDQVQIFYETIISVDDVVLFYEQQMERLGWQLLSQAQVRDQVLIYTKPSQVCTIIISGNLLSIYVSSKKGA